MPAGREKAIQTPKELAKLFAEYLEDINNNPFEVHEFHGKDATSVKRKVQKYPSFVGFEGWLCEQDVITDLGDYESNRNGSYSEFSTIIARIRKVCNSRMLTAAMSGLANQNIVSRLLGLKDQTESTQKVTIDWSED